MSNLSQFQNNSYQPLDFYADERVNRHNNISPIISSIQDNGPAISMRTFRKKPCPVTHLKSVKPLSVKPVNSPKLKVPRATDTSIQIHFNEVTQLSSVKNTSVNKAKKNEAKVTPAAKPQKLTITSIVFSTLIIAFTAYYAGYLHARISVLEKNTQVNLALMEGIISN